MFKTLKARLTILYTISLVLILAIFIFLLYWLVSESVQRENVDELNQFFQRESHEFFEDLFEKEDDHLEHRQNMRVFYYLFDKNQNIVSGEGDDGSFFNKIRDFNMRESKGSFTKEFEWEENHFLLAKYPLQNGDEIYGYVLIGMDITNEKHLIKNMIWILLILMLVFSVFFAFTGYYFAGQAMKPIQKSFQIQKKFVSDASHELRTPLSIFYSSIDLLTKEERDHLSSFGKEILDDMKNESEMMNKLISDLLFLARYDNEKLKIEHENFNLSELLHSLVKRYSRIVPETISLKQNIEENLWMLGEKARIEQLIYILLDNAARYTRNGIVTCSMRAINQKIEIKIEDTGPGISSEDLPHIFDRFFRADSSRNREGSGLGLAIAKTIVDVHEGKIQVYSEPNKGTTFILHFKKK